jgi:hypothetical protein
MVFKTLACLFGMATKKAGSAVIEVANSTKKASQTSSAYTHFPNRFFSYTG